MKTRSTYLFRPFVVICLLFLVSNVYAFQAGKLLNFQGTLYENGEPVKGQRDFEFTISLDNAATWTESHTGVQVIDGLYAVVLGSNTPLPDNLFYNTNKREISVKVGNNVLGTTNIYAPFESFEKFNGGELSFNGVKNINLRNDASGLGSVETFGRNNELLATLKSDTTADNTVEFGNLTLQSSEGHDLAILDRDNDDTPGSGRLRLFAPNDSLNIEVGSNNSYAGGLYLYDSLGSMSTAIAGFNKGGTSLYFFDSLDNTNMRFSSYRNSGSYFEMLDKIDGNTNAVTYQVNGGSTRPWTNMIGREQDGSIHGRIMTGYISGQANPSLIITGSSFANQHVRMEGGENPYLKMSGLDSVSNGNGGYYIPDIISINSYKNGNGNDYASFSLSNTSNNANIFQTFSQNSQGEMIPLINMSSTKSSINMGFSEDQNADDFPTVAFRGPNSPNFLFSSYWGSGDRPYMAMSGIDSVDTGGGNYYIPGSIDLNINKTNAGKDFGSIALNNTLNSASSLLSFSEGNNGVIYPTLHLNGPNGRSNFSVGANWNNPDLPRMFLMGVDSIDAGGGNYYTPELMSFSTEQNSNGKDYSYVTFGNSANNSAFNLRFHDKAQNELLPTIYFDGVKSRIDMGFDDSQNGEDRPLVNFMGPNSSNFSFWGDWANPDLPTMYMSGLDSIDSGGGNYYIPQTMNLAIIEDQNGANYSLLDLNSTHVTDEEVNSNIRLGALFNNANLPFLSMSGQLKDNGNLPELIFLGTGQASGVDHSYLNLGTTTKNNISITSNYDSNLPGMYWHGNQSNERLMDIGGSQDLTNSIDNIFLRLGATNQDSYSSPLFEARTESDANGQWSTIEMWGNSSTNIAIGATPWLSNGDDLGRIGVYGSNSTEYASVAIGQSSTNEEWGSIDLTGTTSGVGISLYGAIDYYDDGSFVNSLLYMNDNSGGFVEIFGNGNSTFSGNVSADTLFHNQIFQNSDRRLKENIHTLSGSLAKVEQLRGVSYSWKNDEASTEKIGFIAQEVESVFPQVVATKADGYKAVNYAELTAVLVEALKELSAEVDALKKENSDLKLKAEESSDLKDQVLSLEERLAQIEALINQRSTGNN